MKKHSLMRKLQIVSLLFVVSVTSFANEAFKGCNLWLSAIDLVGLDAELVRTRDTNWDDIYATGQYRDQSIYCDAQWDYCIVPKEKLIGHTLFVLSDATLSSVYDISSLQGLYNKARTIYGGENLNVDDVSNADKLKQATNPLYRLIAYHILKGRCDYDRLTPITTIETSKTNPTEWYSTMDGGNLLKVEMITTESDIEALGLDISQSQAKKRRQLFLNHSGNKNVRGAKVLRPDEDNIGDNDGSNYYVYELDRFVDYSAGTQATIFNTTMRVDVYTMFPELMTNQIRSDVTNEGQAMSNSKDAACKNYWFPAGYIDGLEANSDAIFIYQGPQNTYWNYEGDAIYLTSKYSSNYDMTMEIPPLPDGNYLIRLGFTNMPTRGICQFYYDGEPMGLPIDMRSNNFEERTGWKDIWTGMSPYQTPTTDAALAVLKDMHSLGWYHGPEDVFCISGEGHEDGDPTVTKNYFSRIPRTCRYVLGNQPIRITNGSESHTIRFKTVLTNSNAVIMLDYLEFVPESEWGDYEPADPMSYDIEKDGIYYRLESDGSASVVCAPEPEKKYSGNIIIPSAIRHGGIVEYPVKSISKTAFYNCSSLTSITIPESMEDIGDGAFFGCTNLESVNIPKNVKNIGSYAFLDCTNLHTVIIDADEIVSQSYDISGYDSYSGIVKIFGSQVKEFIIGENVTCIGENAFRNCPNITSICIPENITTIANGAFRGCLNLTSVEIKSNMLVSGTHTSSNNFTTIFGYQVMEYVLGEDLTSIGDYTFYNSTNLKSIIIPQEVESIGQCAFYGCFGLNNVRIPKSVKHIGSQAFYNLSNVNSITIEGDLKTVGKEAFAGCAGKIYINGNLPSASFKQAGAFYGSVFTEAYIGDGVINLNDYAFADCENLNNVTIGCNMESIGKGAFVGCSNLTTVTCNAELEGRVLVEPTDPATITEVWYPFNPAHNTELDPPTEDNCEETTDVTIDHLYSESEVKNLWLEYYKKVYNTRTATTKKNNKWSSLSSNPYIKLNDTDVAPKVLYESRYSDLLEIYNGYLAYPKVPTTYLDTFDGVALDNATLYVPQGALNEYKMAPRWKEFGTIVEIDPSAVEKIEASEETEANTNAPIYDLNGRRLNKKPAKGIYIQGGKKFASQ